MPLKEKSLIQRIRGQRQPGSRNIVAGIGDDCAVLRLPAGHEALVTTDFSLEGVHFRREWHPPQSVGHRCLTRGLSDIAAMGGEPVAAFLSLALPCDLPQRWLDQFFRGFLDLARRFGVTLAGGDIASSDRTCPVAERGKLRRDPGMTAPILADIVVLGSVPAGQAILRSGARPGDYIYVSGELGRATATLNLLRTGSRIRASAHEAHFFPTPRIAAGRMLREKKLASAMIDISDGLSTDLSHICEESGVGAAVLADKIPQTVGLDLALHGGDDYELLFTARRQTRVPAQIAGMSITRIGEVIAGSAMWLMSADGKKKRLQIKGWEHFNG